MALFGFNFHFLEELCYPSPILKNDEVHPKSEKSSNIGERLFTVEHNIMKISCTCLQAEKSDNLVRFQMESIKRYIELFLVQIDLF